MRKIHFSVWDVADSFKRFDKSERYSVLIVYGEFQFKFSNKQKAERFIRQYEKFISESFNFYALQVPKITESYFLLLPQSSFYTTHEVKECLKFSVDILDKVFNVHHTYNATAIVYWSILLCDELVKCCDLLAKSARNSRYNQSELVKIRQTKLILKSYQDSFLSRYKSYQFKGTDTVTDCKVIRLYDKLQYALNF